MSHIHCTCMLYVYTCNKERVLSVTGPLVHKDCCAEVTTAVVSEENTNGDRYVRRNFAYKNAPFLATIISM